MYSSIIVVPEDVTTKTHNARYMEEIFPYSCVLMRNMAMELLNSEHRRGAKGFTDHLDEDVWYADFSSRWKIPARSFAVREELRLTRALLRRIVETLTERPDDQRQALQDVIRIVGTGAVHYEIEGDGTRTMVRRTISYRPDPVTEAGRSLLDLMIEGDPARIKQCSNPDCRWVFTDQSRNGSRRWCDSSACGTVMKVRAFRSRQSVQPGTDSAPTDSAPRDP